MATKHDLKGRELQIENIKATNNIIEVDGKLKYENANTFNDPQEIVDKNYVDNAIPVGVTTIPYDATNLLDTGSTGDWYLPITLPAGQAILAIRVDEGGNTFFLPVSNYSNGNIYGFTNNSTKTILIKIG